MGMRLMRVARVFYLLHDIANIVTTVRVSGPIVLYNSLLLSGMLYICAIFSMSVIKPDIDKAEASEALLEHWGSLSETYLTMWYFPLFSDWGHRGREIGEVTHWSVYLFIVVMTLLTGLGVLNLGTGIVILQAFKYV